MTSMSSQLTQLSLGTSSGSPCRSYQKFHQLEAVAVSASRRRSTRAASLGWGRGRHGCRRQRQRQLRRRVDKTPLPTHLVMHLQEFHSSCNRSRNFSISFCRLSTSSSSSCFTHSQIFSRCPLLRRSMCRFSNCLFPNSCLVFFQRNSR